MGTKIHCESYIPGFYSMRDLNENSTGSSWPVFYGDKTVSNGQYYNGFVPRTLIDGYSGHDRDSLKQKMLEHEAVFKNQVCELHRLYRIQRDMMEEVKRKEVHKSRASMEPASSSSHHHVPLEDARKWHMAAFPFLNCGYGGTSNGRVENMNSSRSSTKGTFTQQVPSPFQNGSTSKDSEALDCRPLKVRKKLFDLQLPADQYVDPEDEESLHDYKEFDLSSYTKNDGPIMASTSRLMGSTGLADLNKSIQIEDETGQFNENGWFSHIKKPGTSRGNLVPSLGGKDVYPNGYGREDTWREGFRQGLESSRSYDHSNSNSHLCPMVSQNPGSFHFLSSSSFASSSWAHSVSSWAKHARPSVYKELEDQSLSAGFDNLNRTRGTCHAGSRPVIDINLNEALPESPLDEPVIVQNAIKPEDNLRTLPWLKPKPVHVNEIVNASGSDASSNQLSCKNETVGVTLDSEIPRKQKIHGVPVFDRDVPENGPSSKIVDSERKNVMMIDINVACEPEEQMNDEELTLVNEKLKNGPSVIDLNSCVSDYEDPPYERKNASVKTRKEIDLEAPVFLESEDDSTPSKEEEVLSQSLENKHEETRADVLTNAAETLVSISSCLPTESSLEEALLLFVEAVSSCENDGVNTSGKEFRIPEASKEIDDFEAMTLQLAETREEDYMPKPFVPETSKSEEAGPCALTSRTRRGHSRRGRQRRDFQRDILPGLTSLSRHEVTEDLQTLGGLMRATGHSWNSGLARRNGGGRGRRRAAVVVEAGPPVVLGSVCTPLIKQLNSTVESGLEDRSLTGWGKTTRRPRRQRCPAGNPPAAVLTQ